MEVVFYQLAIIGSIAVIFFLVPERYRKKATLAIAAGWTAWTLTVLFLPALILIQLASIWGSILILFKFSRLNKRIKEQEKHIEDEELRKRFSEQIKNEVPTAISGKGHAVYLLKALRKANETLCIFSGWATDWVIDPGFDRLIRDALRRGVNVYIAFGWTSASKPQKAQPTAVRARITLNQIIEWAAQQDLHGKLYVAEFPTHQKLLICDDTFIACGSHNWLSNKGYKNVERSFVYRNPNFIAQERDRAIAEVKANSAN